MVAAGHLTAHKEWTDITDDLDEKVAEISLNHPFVSSTIVLVAAKSIWTPCFHSKVNQITSGKLWTQTRCIPDLDALCRKLPYLAIAKIFD
jgi:hypothetical protein